MGLCHIRKFWTFLKDSWTVCDFCLRRLAGSLVVGVHTRGLVSVFHTRGPRDGGLPRCGVFVVSPEGASGWGFARMTVVLNRVATLKSGAAAHQDVVPGASGEVLAAASPTGHTHLGGRR